LFDVRSLRRFPASRSIFFLCGTTVKAFLPRKPEPKGEKKKVDSGRWFPSGGDCSAARRATYAFNRAVDAKYRPAERAVDPVVPAVVRPDVLDGIPVPGGVLPAVTGMGEAR